MVRVVYPSYFDIAVKRVSSKEQSENIAAALMMLPRSTIGQFQRRTVAAMATGKAIPSEEK